MLHVKPECFGYNDDYNYYTEMILNELLKYNKSYPE